jgi:hypothetical protein
MYGGGELLSPAANGATIEVSSGPTREIALFFNNPKYKTTSFLYRDRSQQAKD